MKKVELIKKVLRLNISIIIFSIVCLSLISLLPWISVQEENFGGENLYFNFDMMIKSNNKQIRDLASDLNLINILLLGLIILSILSIIGAIVYELVKSSPKEYIFLIIGGASLILNIFILVFHLIFINTIGKIDTISASEIFPHLYYAYLPFLFNILLLIYSIRYIWAAVPYSIPKFTSFKKDKDSDKKQVYKKKKEIITKEKPTLEKISLKSEIDDKRDEIDKLLLAEIQKMEKQSVKKSYPEAKIEDQPNLEDIVTPKQTFSEIEPFEIKERKTEKYHSTQEKKSPESYKEIPFVVNNKLEPFLSENKKEEIKRFYDKPLSPSLEEALSSAIQKKQTEINKQETIKDNIGTLKEESEIASKEMILEEPKLKVMVEKQYQKKEEISPFFKEKPVKKKISVRCPQCRFIFITEKDEKITNIRCPKCGKEGVIK